VVEPAQPLTVPVRLMIGDVARDLGHLTVALDTVALDGPDGHRRTLGIVRSREHIGHEVAALLDHAARMLRKGADNAAPRTG
jgi:hypothetical protein